MSRMVTVELTDEEYARIEREAAATSRTLAEVIGAAVRQHSAWLALDTPPEPGEAPRQYAGPITAAEVEAALRQTAAEIAARTGEAPEEVVARIKARIHGAVAVASDDEAHQGDWQSLSKFFGCFDSGDPHSADNDRIDADLAREYGRGLKWDE